MRVAVLMLLACGPSSQIEGDRRVLKSSSGYQTVSMIDGGRTGLYYDMGELVGQMRPDAQRVVLLGLGGGEMLRAARRTLPRAELVGVEISPEVAKLARTDFGMDRLGVRVVTRDAASYVAGMKPGAADALMVDIYDDYRLPDYFQSEAFFVQCRRGLSENGLLLMNVWPPSLAPTISQAMRDAGFARVNGRGASENIVLIAER